MIPSELCAQHLFDGNGRVSAFGGVGPATMIGVRYERRFDSLAFKKDIFTFAQVTSSATRFGTENSEFKIGQRIPVWRKWNIGVIAGLNGSFGNVHTQNIDSKKFALEGDVALGLFREKGFFATTFAYEKILATKIMHSEYYRDRFYDGAVDSWYSGGGGFQFGIEGGIVIKSLIDVSMDLTIPITERFNPMMGSPAYINLSIGYRL
jgi:hypothetical protein